MLETQNAPETQKAHIGVVGAGYVGTATAASFLTHGHRVSVVDADPEVAETLRRGGCPVDEPGVGEAFATAIADHRMTVGMALSAVRDAEVVFVCVPTPAGDGGVADVSIVADVVAGLRDVLTDGATVVIKSTVPVGTCAAAAERLAGSGVAVASNPEFLREGRALHDFLHPARIVIGSESAEALAAVRRLYRDFEAPIIETDCRTAELAKYACNAFLAVKLSYVNELAEVSLRAGADIAAVTQVMGADARIGAGHLRPGPGWGGACLPKDSGALLHTADDAGVPLRTVEAAVLANVDRMAAVAARAAQLARCAHAASRPRVAVLGIAFKPGIADFNATPATGVIGALREAGMDVIAHDPGIVDYDPPAHLSDVEFAGDALIALKCSEAAIVMADWAQYRDIPWEELKPMPIVDPSGCVDDARAREAGCVVTR